MFLQGIVGEFVPLWVAYKGSARAFGLRFRGEYTHRLHSTSFLGITLQAPKYKPRKGTTMEPKYRSLRSQHGLGTLTYNLQVTQNSDVDLAHWLHSSSLWGLPFRILNISHKKGIGFPVQGCIRHSESGNLTNVLLGFTA